MSLRVLNPNAEVLNKSAALHMTINAAKGLQDVLKTNLGPKGTIKMSLYLFYFFPFRFLLVVISIYVLFLWFRLVGGAGDIKLTKDGNTLLKEMVSFCFFFYFFFSYLIEIYYYVRLKTVMAERVLILSVVISANPKPDGDYDCEDRCGAGWR